MNLGICQIIYVIKNLNDIIFNGCHVFSKPTIINAYRVVKKLIRCSFLCTLMLNYWLSVYIMGLFC